MDEKVNDLKDAALSAAAAHIRGQRDDLGRYRFRAICITVAVCVAMICAAVMACVSIRAQQHTIVEQQYAINAQYAQMMDYLRGLEIVTEEATAESSGDGSISVAGDGNVTAGGDVIGE